MGIGSDWNLMGTKLCLRLQVTGFAPPLPGHLEHALLSPPLPSFNRGG